MRGNYLQDKDGAMRHEGWYRVTSTVRGMLCWMMFLLLYLFIDSSNKVVKSMHMLLWTQNLPLFSLNFPCVHITLPNAFYCYSDSKGRDSV